MDLKAWGWDEQWQSVMRGALAEDPGGASYSHAAPGRVIADSRGLFRVAVGVDARWCRLAGRLSARIVGTAAMPVTGDWVLVEADGRSTEWPIYAVLPRRSALSRKSPTDERHAAGEQLLAANVDRIFLVFGLDGGRNFTVRGLERYVTAAWQSGSTPVVVLNKADLAADREQAIVDARTAAPGVDVVATSTVTDGGLEPLVPYLRPGVTVVLVGRSGVGKSTIINRLLGEELLATQASREADLRGRHTTTLRQMVQLASGALLIDTPGLRELGLWGDEEALEGSFAEIAELAADCRFSDCSHRGEPGCAVQQALAEGELDPARFESYLELQRELRYLERKGDKLAQLAEKARGKTLARHIRARERASRKRS